ncbi:hypothetical protein [Lacticaseibacillus camelliae]|uniref:hypothetical protein n=1 Tax=Lacticaseibacillus camelliae TaxID=381742 RepID=UPI0006D26B34|nr:hypothetical protein [Lacticaseibacillus camelliae]
MAHYDGPVFHRQQTTKPAAYPLPPRRLRQHEPAGKSPQDDLAVAPLDALATPDSVAWQRQGDTVDYAQIVQQLTVDPARLYILDDGRPGVDWAQPETESGEEVQTSASAEVGQPVAEPDRPTTATQQQTLNQSNRFRCGPLRMTAVVKPRSNQSGQRRVMSLRKRSTVSSPKRHRWFRSKTRMAVCRPLSLNY